MPAVATSLRLSNSNLKRIHVNQANLRKRVKGEPGGPCYTIKSGGRTYWAREVEINGPSTLVERIDEPLSCGARLWLETRAEILIRQMDPP